VGKLEETNGQSLARLGIEQQVAGPLNERTHWGVRDDPVRGAEHVKNRRLTPNRKFVTQKLASVALYPWLRGPSTSTHNEEVNQQMKKLLSIITITAFALGLSAESSAAEKKDKPAAEKPADAAKKPAEAAKPAPEKVTGDAKSLPMNSRADLIDAKAKTFTMKRKDGVEVKHVLTDTTEIKNGESAAKMEDIKVGDYVSGLRKKVSDTEYTVVKVTKFGPKPEKKEGESKPDGDKPAEKPAAEKKMN
jgi:hypothetical protein